MHYHSFSYASIPNTYSKLRNIIPYTTDSHDSTGVLLIQIVVLLENMFNESFTEVKL